MDIAKIILDTQYIYQMNNQVTLAEFKKIFNYLLDNNKRLIESGQTPIAVGAVGDAGVGN